MGKTPSVPKIATWSFAASARHRNRNPPKKEPSNTEDLRPSTSNSDHFHRQFGSASALHNFTQPSQGVCVCVCCPSLCPPLEPVSPALRAPRCLWRPLYGRASASWLRCLPELKKRFPPQATETHRPAARSAGSGSDESVASLKA